MSTITDVAKAAGVSVATVSRALRGLDRVSPATRAKVLKVASEMDYVASPTATSLASGRTRVVAVVAPFLTRWFFATLVSAIEKTLRPHGHHVLLLRPRGGDLRPAAPADPEHAVEAGRRRHHPQHPDDPHRGGAHRPPRPSPRRGGLSRPGPPLRPHRRRGRDADRHRAPHRARPPNGSPTSARSRATPPTSRPPRPGSRRSARTMRGAPAGGAGRVGPLVGLDRRRGVRRRGTAAPGPRTPQRRRRRVGRDRHRDPRRRPAARPAGPRRAVHRRHRRLHALGRPRPDHGAPGRHRAGTARCRGAARRHPRGGADHRALDLPADRAHRAVDDGPAASRRRSPRRRSARRRAGAPTRR